MLSLVHRLLIRFSLVPSINRIRMLKWDIVSRSEVGPMKFAYVSRILPNSLCGIKQIHV